MGKKSLRKEILRKLFHLMEVPVVIGYTLVRHYFNERLATLVITVLFLLLLEIEYVRLEYKPKIPDMFDVFRHSEQNNITGTIFFIAATIIVFAAFDYPIAITALLLTVFGDLAAALVGIKFGKRFLHKDKTLEGLLAGFTMNCIVGYLCLPAYPAIFFSMAAVASIVELLTGKLDDNLTVPLFSAFTGQIIVYLIGAPLTAFPGPVVGPILNFFVNFH